MYNIAKENFNMSPVFNKMKFTYTLISIYRTSMQ